MTSLYELSQQYAALLECMADCDEISREQEQRIDDLHDKVENKIINVAKYIKNLIAQFEAIEDHLTEITLRATDRMKAISAEIQRKKEYVKHTMRLSALDKVFSPEFDISIVKNPPKAHVYDDELIPPEYHRVIKERYVSRKLVLDALKKGVDVPGARMVIETRLKIY